MSTDLLHAKPPLAVIGPPPPIYPETLALLQSLVDDAASGHVQGLAIVVLRDRGAYDLMIHGSAREEANHDAVVGMLTALQQSILEVH